MPPKRKNTPLNTAQKVKVIEKTVRKKERKKKNVLEPVPVPEELPGLLSEAPVIIDENATIDGFCDFCLEIVNQNLISKQNLCPNYGSDRCVNFDVM